MAGPQRRARWYLVDLAYRRALARSAGTLSALPDLSHRRFQRWNEEGVLDGVLRALAEDLKERGGLDLSECFVDGTFVGAKKGEHRWERPNGARARSSWRWQMALADGSGLPLAVCAASASPHEVTLVGVTLEASFLEERPEKLIGDRAYDSDPLDQALAEEGIEMIAPHRKNRRKPKTQDGRKLRRYKRRWKIERLL